MRHAYLIMAHNEFGILQRLVRMLDDADNDIYVHFDRKVKRLPGIGTQKSRLFVLGERECVNWGTVSQIRTEFRLLEGASENGPYDFYHIISGTHLPLKPLSEPFYASHKGQEIMRFWDKDEGTADFKLRRYHFFLKVHFLWRLSLKVQKMTGIRHLRKESFHKTDNWMSITEAACRYLLDNKDDILRKYRYTFCGDEYFIASELIKKGGFDIYDCPDLLYVTIEKANASLISLSSYDSLSETPFLWGRKFTEQ